jgi:iron complex outermembrane receptor protein
MKKKKQIWRRLGRLSLATACAWSGLGAATAAEDRGPLSSTDLSGMSLEDLANVEISSVSKRPERLTAAAAAVYVISREDIRRSGYTSIPEILRLAPNLNVARQDASQYAITARGFNSTTANKLLVLIDGRSSYTPLFSGVFWDVQDTFIEDIERIEVISGPGGTLWGANAVNGVINVITRNARDTAGALVSVAGGPQERNAGARWGGKLGENASFRVYAKGFERDNTERASGASVRDDFRNRQIGFRIDGGRLGNAFTLQGDSYDGSIDQAVSTRKQVSGTNLLARWNKALDDGSTMQVQAYFDHSQRDYPGTFAESLDTYDIEAQHNFTWRGTHQVLWGGGYRSSRDSVDNGLALAFLPAKTRLSLVNVFAQDTVALSERLRLTLGIKFERNNYTGLEIQPNARLAWQLADNSLLWTGLSRAVRTPSRLDRELFSPGSPPFTVLAGGPNFQSEKLTALEVGYRAQPSPRFSYAVTAYRHKYDDLRSLEGTSPTGGLPAVISNMMQGHIQGVEFWGTWRPVDWWRLSAGLNTLHKKLGFKPGSRDLAGVQAAGNDPDHKITLRSSMNLGPRSEFDVILRSVAALPNPAIPSYVALDVRWAWQFSEDAELSLTGFNLLDRGHPEFGSLAARSEIARSFLVKLTWKL